MGAANVFVDTVNSGVNFAQRKVWVDLRVVLVENQSQLQTRLLKGTVSEVVMKKIILLLILITLGTAGILAQQSSVDQSGATKRSTEPATMLLFGAGLIGLAGIRLKGKK